VISAVLAAALAVTPISLDEVREASRRATSAQLSELDRLRAEQDLIRVRSALLPQVRLNLNGSYTMSGERDYQLFPSAPITVIPATNQGNLRFVAGLNQSVFDPALWANAGVSSAQLHAAAEQAREDRLTAELEGIRRFFDLLRAQRSTVVIEARVKNSEEFVTRAEALFQAGRRRKEDAISARVNLGNDRIALLQQQALAAQTCAVLAAWIGREVTSDLLAQAPASLTAPPGPAPSFDQAMATARKSRPQLLAYGALTKAAQDAVAAARAAYLPTVSAGLSYDRGSFTFKPFFDLSKQHSVTGSLTVGWDLFSGFATSAQVEQAVIAQRRAALTLEQAERDVAADVLSRIRALEVQVQVVDLAAQNLKLAQDNLALAQARFDEGAGSTLEIRDAQVKQTAAALIAVESRIDLEIARAALERAIGALGPGVAQ